MYLIYEIESKCFYPIYGMEGLLTDSSSPYSHLLLAL